MADVTNRTIANLVIQRTKNEETIKSKKAAISHAQGELKTKQTAAEKAADAYSAAGSQNASGDVMSNLKTKSDTAAYEVEQIELSIEDLNLDVESLELENTNIDVKIGEEKKKIEEEQKEKEKIQKAGDAIKKAEEEIKQGDAELKQLKEEKGKILFGAMDRKLKADEEKLKEDEKKIEDIEKYGFACENDAQRAQAEADIKEFGKALGHDVSSYFERESLRLKKEIDKNVKNDMKHEV